MYRVIRVEPRLLHSLGPVGSNSLTGNRAIEDFKFICIGAKTAKIHYESGGFKDTQFSVISMIRGENVKKEYY
jgi:hypothetical protein